MMIGAFIYKNSCSLSTQIAKTTGVFSNLCFPSPAVFHEDAGLFMAWKNLALEGF
jgi:hypothetical protein